MSEGGSMPEQLRPPGKTTIAPDVLVSIARLTALNVPGVARLADTSQEVESIFRRGFFEGVRISVENNTVFVDLYVVLHRDQNIREVSHAIQAQVARAISEMVGMEIGKINIHVEDIDYAEESTQPL
jgi:uncharacterized alkaline shock family protein YloU